MAVRDPEPRGPLQNYGPIEENVQEASEENKNKIDISQQDEMIRAFQGQWHGQWYISKISYLNASAQVENSAILRFIPILSLY